MIRGEAPPPHLSMAWRRRPPLPPKPLHCNAFRPSATPSSVPQETQRQLHPNGFQLSRPEMGLAIPRRKDWKALRCVAFGPIGRWPSPAPRPAAGPTWRRPGAT